MTRSSNLDGQVRNADLHISASNDGNVCDDVTDDLKSVLFINNTVDNNNNDDEEDIFTLSLPGFDSPSEIQMKKKKKRSSKRSKTSRQPLDSRSTTQKNTARNKPNTNLNGIYTPNNKDSTNIDSDEEEIDLGHLKLPGISYTQKIQTSSIVRSSFLAVMKSISNVWEQASGAFSSSNLNSMRLTPSVSPLSNALIKVAMGVVVSLYILNQNHMLPRDLSGVVSRVLFWPTMPLAVIKRFGEWTSTVDENVIIGGIPFGFLGYPEHLRKELGVRGVINMCEEYRGPWKKYDKLGIEELWLPTTDHFEPSFEDLKRAVQFIKKYESRGKRVYVHCRAGHGRSAAVVFAYLLSKAKDRGVLEILDLRELNLRFLEVRDVRKTLYKQPNIIKYRTMLGLKGKGHGGTDLALSEALKTFYAPTIGSMNLAIYEDLIMEYATAKSQRRSK